MTDLLKLLAERVVIADGAMGTRLQELTGNVHACIDAFNLNPTFSEIVCLVHRSYIEAGADFILTNTYGANRIKLARYGRNRHTREINLEGARLAKKCAGERAMVGGSVGPLEVYPIRDEFTEAELQDVFREQIDALVEGGVDLLVLETFQDVEESTLALRAAARHEVPIVFSVGGVLNGRTGTGADARELAHLAGELGASVVGCNCRGPFDILETTRMLAEVTSLPLIAMPNAGCPEIDRGRVAYQVEPAHFRSYAERLVGAGAAVVGGCCGTGPEHIRQIAEAVREIPPPPPRKVSEVRVFSVPSPGAPDGRALPPNPVEQVFRTLPFVVSVEMRPARNLPLAEFMVDGHRLCRVGVHLFDVPDNAGAKVTVDPMIAAARLQQETKIPTIMHLGTSHRNLVATQSYLLGCWEAGLQSILAVTGDHPNVGDHDKYANRVNDVKSSVNLMRLIGKLNTGRLFNEAPCVRTNFLIGGGFNPVRGLTAQLKWVAKKIEAGARYIYTQPVYTEEAVDRMLEETAQWDVPFLVGVLPLTSRRNAEFFAAGKIPGIIVPEEILKKFEKVDRPEDGRKLGADLAAEFISKVRDRIRGIYVIPPFAEDRYGMVIDILDASGVTAPKPV